jgi:hypothetical protein
LLVWNESCVSVTASGGKSSLTISLRIVADDLFSTFDNPKLFLAVNVDCKSDKLFALVNFSLREVAVVVAKLASLPSAADSSLNVSKTLGAEETKPAISPSTYVLFAK